MTGSPFKNLLDKTVGALTVGLLYGIKHTDRRRMANLAGAFMRKIGPLFKEHRIGREQLRAAFPDKSDAEIEYILGGVSALPSNSHILTNFPSRVSASRPRISSPTLRSPRSATTGS